MRLFHILSICVAAVERQPEEAVAFTIDSEASINIFRQLHLLWPDGFERSMNLAGKHQSNLWEVISGDNLSMSQ